MITHHQLAALRLRHALTQAQMARYMGFSRYQTVGDQERGLTPVDFAAFVCAAALLNDTIALNQAREVFK